MNHRFIMDLRVGDFRLGSERLHNVSSTKDVNLTLDLSKHNIDSISCVTTKGPSWCTMSFKFNIKTKVLVILVCWNIEINDDLVFNIEYFSEFESRIENRDNKINEILG